MAFLVFVRHFSLPWQPNLDYGFGQGDDHRGIFRLPVLRILYAGPNVPVFLIVSGYVMSLKPLRLLNEGQKEIFLQSLVSSIFRRAIRIFPPPIFSTFIFMLAVHFGLFKFQYYSMDEFIPHHPDRLSTLLEQFRDWLQFVFEELANPWTWKTTGPDYGAHLWTISLQFRSSMVLFLTLIGLANTRKSARQILLGGFFVYCMSYGRWDVALYLSGMFMAGTGIGTADSSTSALSLSDLEKSIQSTTGPFRSRIYWLGAVLGGLYLSSYPRARDGVGAPGYTALYRINPSYVYWQGCGAILLIWGLICSKTAQIPFNSSLPRYLGKISFSLYIVHEPLLHVLGYWTVNSAWGFTGKETPFQYQLGFFLALLLTTPILLVSLYVFCNNLAQVELSRIF
jgi:peptidoglycan/LPS O-acetylase OafA/YrhL